jgi:hypothetical protein
MVGVPYSLPRSFIQISKGKTSVVVVSVRASRSLSMVCASTMMNSVKLWRSYM